MLNKIADFINFHLAGLGFTSIGDLTESTFRLSSAKPMALTSFSLGGLSLIVEQYLGLTALVYIAFMILIGAEFWTGIIASRAKGNKIQSRKMGRMLVKMSVYTLIIGGLHTFSIGLKIPEIVGFQVNLFQWVYYAAVIWIIFQLLISLFENLTELGFEETSGVFKILKKKLEKWFELKNVD